MEQLEEMLMSFEKRVCMVLLYSHRCDAHFPRVHNAWSGCVELELSYEPGQTGIVCYGPPDGTGRQNWFTCDDKREHMQIAMLRKGPCPWRENFVWKINREVDCVDFECVVADMQIAKAINTVTFENIGSFLPNTPQSRLQRDLSLVELYFVLEFELCMARQMINIVQELGMVAHEIKMEYSKTHLIRLFSKKYSKSLPAVVSSIMWFLDASESKSEQWQTWEETKMLKQWMTNIRKMRNTDAHYVLNHVVQQSQSSAWYCSKCARAVVEGVVESNQRQSFNWHGGGVLYF